MPYRIKRKREFTPAQWAGGSTTELFITPEGASNAERNFELRISSATVELEESVFSDFSGYERHIAPLSGTMRLEHAGHHSVTLAPCETDSFEGSWTTSSFGKCVDFNLIHRPGWRGKIEGFVSAAALPLEGKGYMGIYALADGVAATMTLAGVTHGETLQAGDFLLVETEGRAGDYCHIEGTAADGKCFAVAALAFR